MKYRYTYFLMLLAFFLNTPDSVANNRYPLEPPDTSSPRATLQGFQDTVRNAEPIMEKVKTQGFSSSITRELRDLRIQAMYFLDLSQVPDRLRRDVGPESAVLLAEILGRIELPPYQEIPDADAMESKKVFQWKIPHTEITITRIEEGPRRGEYLFTAETVARLREFFSKVRDLPYTPDAVIKKLGPAGGLYEYYMSSPRGNIPVRLIEILPSWAKSVYYDQAVWQWIGLVLTLVAGFLVIVFIYVLVRWRTKGRDIPRVWRALINMILPLSAAIVVPIVGYIIDGNIGIRGKVLDAIEISTWVLLLIFVIWNILAFAGFVGEAIIASPMVDRRGLKPDLIKISCKIIALAIAAIIIFKGLSQLGITLLPILTGLGVGGFALALAARPTIENLIGGLMILADTPYTVGQRIKVGDKDGVVQEIGLRSTKIRLLNGQFVSIPNEQMARVEIVNVARRQYLKRSTSITITYDTPPEKVEKAVDIVRNVLKDHEGMAPKLPARVYFTEFNPDSLNISMMYWYHPAKFYKFREFNQKINLKIMNEFTKEGIKFAYPTTTTYLAQEDEHPLYFCPAKDSPASNGRDNMAG
jgi:MscS family membrane protein